MFNVCYPTKWAENAAYAAGDRESVGRPDIVGNFIRPLAEGGTFSEFFPSARVQYAGPSGRADPEERERRSR